MKKLLCVFGLAVTAIVGTVERSYGAGGHIFRPTGCSGNNDLVAELCPTARRLGKNVIIFDKPPYIGGEIDNIEAVKVAAGDFDWDRFPRLSGPYHLNKLSPAVSAGREFFNFGIPIVFAKKFMVCIHHNTVCRSLARVFPLGYELPITILPHRRHHSERLKRYIRSELVFGGSVGDFGGSPSLISSVSRYPYRGDNEEYFKSSAAKLPLSSVKKFFRSLSHTPLLTKVVVCPALGLIAGLLIVCGTFLFLGGWRRLGGLFIWALLGVLLFRLSYGRF
tara:strand:- start:2048 stop:2881 length:834 start_codon:yes stop_codon:yes gene_type:complete